MLENKNSFNLTFRMFRHISSEVTVKSARISTLEKQNVDCMTEKLNILKGSRVPVMHLLSQITSRQLVTT